MTHVDSPRDEASPATPVPARQRTVPKVARGLMLVPCAGTAVAARRTSRRPAARRP
jgi:hypothetical protein